MIPLRSLQIYCHIFTFQKKLKLKFHPKRKKKKLKEERNCYPKTNSERSKSNSKFSPSRFFFSDLIRSGSDPRFLDPALVADIIDESCEESLPSFDRNLKALNGLALSFCRCVFARLQTVLFEAFICFKSKFKINLLFKKIKNK